MLLSIYYALSERKLPSFGGVGGGSLFRRAMPDANDLPLSGVVQRTLANRRVPYISTSVFLCAFSVQQKITQRTTAAARSYTELDVVLRVIILDKFLNLFIGETICFSFGIDGKKQDGCLYDFYK